MAHHLLIYTLAPDYLDARAAHRDAHLALAWAAAERGELLLGGALEPADTAMLLFTDAAAAEAFAKADPYVINGLIQRWQVRRWITVVGDGASSPVRP